MSAGNGRAFAVAAESPLPHCTQRNRTDMTITWRGMGFLGFMVPLAMLAISITLGSGVNDFASIRIGMLASAAVVWFAGQKLNGEAMAAGDEAPHQCMGMKLQTSAVISLIGFGLTFL